MLKHFVLNRDELLIKQPHLKSQVRFFSDEPDNRFWGKKSMFGSRSGALVYP